MALVASHDFNAATLQTVATSYLAAAAALFGVVIAGLSVLAAFVAGQTLDVLYDRAPELLRNTYAVFYWIAALSVASIVCTVGLLVTTSVSTNTTYWAAAATIATALFLKTMLGSLFLVGRIIRLALYGPAFKRVFDDR